MQLSAGRPVEADLLWGDHKESDYGKVVLPLVVLRRLDHVLGAVGRPRRATIGESRHEVRARSRARPSGRWGTDVRMTSDVAAVRQNLQPIVSRGEPVPGLATDSSLKWGATLGNSVLVWRSGIGVTRDGALLYAAGPGLSVQTLANVLARAGAVRAMELDINPEWTTAMYYTQTSASAATPHKLLDAMQRSSNRYLVPDERDFFAMFIPRRYVSNG